MATFHSHGPWRFSLQIHELDSQQYYQDASILIMMVDSDSRTPLIQRNGDAHQPNPQVPNSYAQLVAEADELLQLVQNIRPVSQHVEGPALKEAKVKANVETNLLSVVRVTVGSSAYANLASSLAGTQPCGVLCGFRLQGAPLVYQLSLQAG